MFSVEVQAEIWCQHCERLLPFLAAPGQALLPFSSTVSNGHKAEIESFKFSAAKEPSKLSCQETTGGLPQHPATHEDNMAHHALVGREVPQGVIQTVSEGSSSSTADVSPFDRSRAASISF